MIIKISIPSVDRYSTLRLINGWDQQTVTKAKVLVVGAGALGNEILKNLALLGIGHIFVIDFDTIELSNLTRSTLFRIEDKGRYKAEVAAERLKELNPDIKVQAIVGDVRWDFGLGVLRRMKVVLGGLDNRAARIAINEKCLSNSIPWVDGAISESAGMVGVFMPNNGACYECSMSHSDYKILNTRYSCQGIQLENFIEGKIPTTPTIASIIAAMQVQEAVKILHCWPLVENQELLYDSMNYTLQTVKLQQREDCLAHYSLKDIIELPEYTVSTITAGDLLERVRADLGPRAWIELDREIIFSSSCLHGKEEMLLPQHKLKEGENYCATCGERLLEMTHQIKATSPYLERTLSEWGMPLGHIFVGRNEWVTKNYEFTGDVNRLLGIESS